MNNCRVSMKSNRRPVDAVRVLTVAIGALAALLAMYRAAGAGQEPSVVRLAVVNAPLQSGLLDSLLPEFEKASGYKVQVHGGSDVFAVAERGEADLVIAHLGKAGAESFVSRGLGAWPHTVFSNQMVLVGPAADPAGIRGMSDPFAAMRRIAERRATFVCPADAGARYLCELLLAGAGAPERGSWYVEATESKGQAMRQADARGAYTVWGSFPFERFRRSHDTGLQVVVWNTPIFHRVMATFVVNPAKFPAANAAGARALESWLLSPPAQAAVAAFREPGLDRQTWWPAARNNNPAELLGLPTTSDTDE
jgi:tungstate transport system substrate-binding protein